ncbi:hypothetical protein [Aquitalea sp. FJL05]|uniref:hypothetical protein n=1 Tax=Aquitalea sp. FJL05 TaxID=2153366 RepID=UPI000F5A77CD|nr:hypothetical protein [Aquitalea sp. FJL05]
MASLIYNVSRVLMVLFLVVAHYYHAKYRYGLKKEGRSIFDFGYTDNLINANPELKKIKNIRDNLIWLCVVFLIISIVSYFCGE